MTPRTVVVMFRSDTAESDIKRFIEFAGPDVPVRDLGTMDGRRRFSLPQSTWVAYTHAVSARTSKPLIGPIPLERCPEPGCRVEAAPGPLAAHRKARGHGA